MKEWGNRMQMREKNVKRGYLKEEKKRWGKNRGMKRESIIGQQEKRISGGSGTATEKQMLEDLR